MIIGILYARKAALEWLKSSSPSDNALLVEGGEEGRRVRWDDAHFPPA